MKHFLSILPAVLLFSMAGSSQDFTGQWKGKFVDKSSNLNGWGNDSCEYTLDLNEVGNKVSGFSYTYFSDGGSRYYTICSVEGMVDPKHNYVVVREIKRTKTNVPEKIQNCFQVHKLFYKKNSDGETLSGSWLPAPGQNADCGHGLTMLSRRMLRHDIPSFAKSSNSNSYPSSNRKKEVISNAKKEAVPAIASRQPNARSISKSKSRHQPEKNNLSVHMAHQPIIITREEPLEESQPPLIKEKDPLIIPGFEVRNSTVLQTIEVSLPRVQVDLYDNGEIDGDSISLFYNGKLILAHQRLSDKPITLQIDVANYDCSNELVMYADNLGSIPPNTALMIVTDGPKRYEVRITSDLKKSGAIRFRRE